MKTCYIETPLGIAEIVGDIKGIASVSVLDEFHTPTQDVPEELQDCVFQLQEYFEGKRKTFNLKLNPQGTSFQQDVWQHLLDIPFGKTQSYLDLSRQLGDEKAIRAVASANGKNPLWIIVPCHRVIGSDGSLTGYAGGLNRKQWLLNHEKGTVQHTLF